MNRNRYKPDNEGRGLSACLLLMILAELALFAVCMDAWIAGPR